MKKILFSPVGTMDPVANYSDGPLLHIARKVKPDKIYIYISNELFEKTKEDKYSVDSYKNLNRYEYCLRNLEKMIRTEEPDYNLDIKYLIGDKEEKIYEYNEMLKVFRDLVNNILNLDKDDILYLNTSSGTPAMKYALYIQYVAAKTNNIKGYQVKTPTKSINKREEKVDKYDAEIYWELNEDNIKDHIDRTVELKDENLNFHFKKEAIISHLNNFEYIAAYEIGKNLKGFLSNEVLEILEFSADRVRLKQIRGIDFKKYNIKLNDSFKEYILVMDIKLFKYEDSDFIRAFTPIFENLLEKIILEKFKFNISNIAKKDNKWDIYKFKTENEDLFNYLNNEYNKFGGFVQSDSLAKIYGYYSNSDNLFKDILYLREFEEDIRNKVAHTLTQIDRDNINKGKDNKHEYNLNNVMKKLKRIYLEIYPSNNYWKDYEDMNEVIIDYLK